MQSFICFVRRLNLNYLATLFISDEYRGIVDKCSLNRATDLFPRMLLLVELESHGKNDHIVNIYSDMPLLFHSL